MLYSIINHKLRRDLGLGCFQYIILDVLYQTKGCSVLFIASALSVGEQLVEEKLKSMNDMEPNLVYEDGNWRITDYANKILSGEMFVTEKPRRIKPKSDMADRVITYFNNLNNTRYSPETYAKEIQGIISKKKDLTFEHFEAVIKHKFLTWGNDEKMKEYNRPKTLFSTKFLSYLDDARIYWDKKLKEQTDYSEINR